MTVAALTGARILAADGWHEHHAVLITDGVIAGLCDLADVPADARRTALDGGMILPGFIDTQVNGGGGVLFNHSPTVVGVAQIAAAHRRYGTTAMLPTIISDDLAVVARAIAAVDAAIVAGVSGVLGIHIEGPFLNAGKKGIHDAAKFRTIDAEAMALLGSLSHGRTLVTLAPECAPPGTIRALVERGVIVAAGHTLADYDTMMRAIDEGCSATTHLFNAMTQLDSRHPGVVGAAMDRRLRSGIIVDGHHVHPATLRVALAAMGPDALMLVTDAMPTVGSADKSFMLGDRRIVAMDGACRSADGTLAGSDLDMAQALRNAVAMLGIDVATASRMASASPAGLIGQQGRRGAIAAGMAADLVHMNDAMQVTTTWIGGVACAADPAA